MKFKELEDFNDTWQINFKISLIFTGAQGSDVVTMIDFNNMHQIVSHRVPATRISTFLVTIISFLLILILCSTCVMCITYVRRKLKKTNSTTNGLFCRSETSETLIESTLINADAPTMYSAIDV